MRHSKISTREQLKGLSSDQFAKIIGVVSNLAPLKGFTDAGAAALVVTIPHLRHTRASIGLLALRPVLIAEAPKNRDLTSQDVEILRDCADAIIANTYDEITTFKTQVGSVDVIFVAPHKESKESEHGVLKKAFEVGARAVIFKDQTGRDVSVYPDMKAVAPLRFSFALHLDNVPVPKSAGTAASRPLVKVCGVKTVEAAKTALEHGADMIGMILVPGRARTVNVATALEISAFVRSYERPQPAIIQPMRPGQNLFEYYASISQQRPQIVGVFRNQPLASVLDLQHQLQLDIVQLHGDEPLEWCRLIPVPVIKRFTPGTPAFEECLLPGYFKYALLDSELGGEGKVVDRSLITDVIGRGARFMLAGGLTAENVGEAVKVDGVVGVDVSGGVETNGVKDLDKVKRFVVNALAVPTT